MIINDLLPRQIKFDHADIISMPMQSLIVGYLMDEIPKAIINTVTLIANMPTPLFVTEEFKSENRQSENSEGLLVKFIKCVNRVRCKNTRLKHLAQIMRTALQVKISSILLHITLVLCVQCQI